MRSRRNTELLLLIAGLPILALLYGMYLLNTTTTISWDNFLPVIGLFAAFVISHLVCRKFAPGADPAILPITFLLAGVGIIFVMRLAPELALRQTLWLYVGIAAMVLVLIFVKSFASLARYKYTIMLVGIVLLVLPAIIGTEKYGSKIWITIGDFSFQPGEVAKILIVVFLAGYLAENREMLSVNTRKIGPFKLPDASTFFPLIVMLVIALLLMVFERDLGSALLFLGTFLIMVYVSTGRWLYVVVGVVLFAAAGFAAYHLFSHVQERFDVWLNPFEYSDDEGYQLVQAIYSMADGGLFGVGIGRGMPTKIPVVESDFIFAAIAEEMGLLGAAGVLLLYILFAIRGFLTASRAKSDVEGFAAAGLTTSVSLQAFVIVGGVTRLIPLTGLTLPFMSQGGSSLLASFIIVGLLLRIGNDASGLETEMTGTIDSGGGVLGRYALGRRISVVTVVFAVLFAVLVANLTYIQVIRADYYKSLPTNNHTLEKAQRNQRGSITTADGVVLAESVLSDDGVTYERLYPHGTLAAHVVGYSSLQYGTSGVENEQNDYLVGDTGYSTWSEAIESLAGTPTHGNNVVLTIDSSIQEAAESALEGKTGACVVLDPTTGEVLAEASNPTYDPGSIDEALSSDSSGLYNRATQALYAPGSTFKTITLAAALQEGVVTADSVYDSPSTIDIGGAAVTNNENEQFGEITVTRATEVSSNTVFGQIAAQLGSERLVSYSEAFGFNSDKLALDFSLATSLMPDADEMTEWETAWAGCGQPVGEHESAAGPQATPMQMACTMAAISNEGGLMRPYIVSEIMSASGEVLSTTKPRLYGTAIDSETASAEMQILYDVVNNGSASAARVEGATVYGKTGTAETGKETDDAWFVGCAEANGQKVVVAIVIEEGGHGSQAAAPLASTVMEAALKAKDAL